MSLNKLAFQPSQYLIFGDRPASKVSDLPKEADGSYLITKSGSYVLDVDFEYKGAGPQAIAIGADDVVLHLSGHTLSAGGSVGDPKNGITVAEGKKGVKIYGPGTIKDTGRPAAWVDSLPTTAFPDPVPLGSGIRAKGAIGCLVSDITFRLCFVGVQIYGIQCGKVLESQFVECGYLYGEWDGGVANPPRPAGGSVLISSFSAENPTTEYQNPPTGGLPVLRDPAKSVNSVVLVEGNTMKHTGRYYSQFGIFVYGVGAASVKNNICDLYKFPTATQGFPENTGFGDFPAGSWAPISGNLFSDAGAAFAFGVVFPEIKFGTEITNSTALRTLVEQHRTAVIGMSNVNNGLVQDNLVRGGLVGILLKQNLCTQVIDNTHCGNTVYSCQIFDSTCCKARGNKFGLAFGRYLSEADQVSLNASAVMVQNGICNEIENNNMCDFGFLSGLDEDVKSPVEIKVTGLTFDATTTACIARDNVICKCAGGVRIEGTNNTIQDNVVESCYYTLAAATGPLDHFGYGYYDTQTAPNANIYIGNVCVQPDTATNTNIAHYIGASAVINVQDANTAIGGNKSSNVRHDGVALP